MVEDSLRTLSDFKHVIKELTLDFLKHIVTVSAALLALLVSLKSPSDSSNCLFFSVLVSLLLCILAGTLALYISLIQHRKVDKDLAEAIREQIDKRTEKHWSVFPKYGSLMLFLELISLVSFLSSFVLLVAYVYYL